MANPHHHAVSSQRKWGGLVEDYLPIHAWFDESKAHLADFRHRALRHHTEGIFLCESIFGTTITLSVPCEACKGTGYMAVDSFGGHGTCARCEGSCKQDGTGREIPVRWIGEQHVREDLGCIPSAADWLRCIKSEPWMNRSRPLSRELDASPDVVDAGNASSSPPPRRKVCRCGGFYDPRMGDRSRDCVCEYGKRRDAALAATGHIAG